MNKEPRVAINIHYEDPTMKVGSIWWVRSAGTLKIQNVWSIHIPDAQIEAELRQEMDRINQEYPIGIPEVFK